MAIPEAWMSDIDSQLFGNTIAELSTWYGFSPKYQEDRRRRRVETAMRYDLSAPATNPFKSFGRNDPCPCGSGKKYKKCCLGQALPVSGQEELLRVPAWR